MEDKKWLIIGIIIICAFFILKFGNTIMLNILLFIWIFGTLFLPYIIGIVISVIIIFLIRKRLNGRNKNSHRNKRQQPDKSHQHKAPNLPLKRNTETPNRNQRHNHQHHKCNTQRRQGFTNKNFPRTVRTDNQLLKSPEFSLSRHRKRSQNQRHHQRNNHIKRNHQIPLINIIRIKPTPPFHFNRRNRLWIILLRKSLCNL